MARTSVSKLTERELALKVLSRLLYFMAGRSSHAEEIRCFHKKLLGESFLASRQAEADFCSSGPDPDTFSIRDIPWSRLFDSIADQIPFLKELLGSGRFSEHEIRYMCAMLCGLSGREYGLVTGFRSHYNLSWTIRHKLGIPANTTNLRLALSEMAESGFRCQGRQCGPTPERDTSTGIYDG